MNSSSAAPHATLSAIPIIAIELSWKEFAVAFVGLELGINVVFVLLYLARPECAANMRPGSFSDAFFFSMETLATVGYGTMAPATLYGHAISAIETVCGMVFTAIMTGLLFVRFSKPRLKILFADQAVVTSHNCSPTLMVRIANGRMTLLTNATVRMGVLLFEESAEGNSLRRLHCRTRVSLFALTWTMIHVIDEKSPLAGYDAERLEERDARLFLSIEARDHAIGALVGIYTAAFRLDRFRMRRPTARLPMRFLAANAGSPPTSSLPNPRLRKPLKSSNPHILQRTKPMKLLSGKDS